MTINKKKYLITVQYDGLSFKGWQRLSDDDNTVQGTLERALASIFNTPIRITGSGRTDAGVSAVCQYADFVVDESAGRDTISAETVNEILPDTVRVTSVREVPMHFHSRKSCVSKTYRYRIALTSKPDVFVARYVYNPVNAPLGLPFGYMEDKGLDVHAMKTAAQLMCGTHDYRAFTSDKRTDISTVRTVQDIRIEISGDICDIYVTGDGFLYNMVRIICGTLVQIGLGSMSAGSVRKALEGGERKLAGVTLPSNGLELVGCRYE